jgi:hypothetical protein
MKMAVSTPRFFRTLRRLEEVKASWAAFGITYSPGRLAGAVRREHGLRRREGALPVLGFTSPGP